MNPFESVSRGLLGIAVFGGLGLVAACHREKEVKPVAPGVLAVEVSPPQERTIPFFETFTGRLEAVDTVEIRARVSGYLMSVDFEPGSEVERDQVLFHIDDRPYQDTVDRIQAEIEGENARLQRRVLELNRAKQLIGSKTISKEEYELNVANTLEAQASVASLKAQLKSAKLNLEWTKVTAPRDGQISRNYISAGNLVLADQTKLTTLVADDKMYAYFNVDENSLLRFQRLIREGKIEVEGTDKIAIDLILSDGSVYPYPGEWNFQDIHIDPGTGTLQFRALFPNPKVPARPKGSAEPKEERLLISEMFCNVRLPMGKPRAALLVPESAVLTDQDEKHLYVVDPENKVEDRRVEIGPAYENLRVIDSGLKPGDRVIISGTQRVRPGMTVKPLTPEELKLK